MPQEKDEHIVEGSGLSNDPTAQDLWNQIDAEESAGQVHEPTPAKDAPGTGEQANTGIGNTEPAANAADSGAVDDPYKDLPQAVKDEILGLKATVESLNGRVRNAEGHIGGLRSQVQRDLQVAAATARQAGADAPTQEQLASASKSPQALARLKEDYPEFGAAIEEVVQAQAQEIARLQQAVSASSNAPRGSDEVIAQLQWQLTDVKISVRHPNWKEEVAKPDFDQWVARQPREVQALRHSDNPDDVSRLLDIRAAQVKASQAAERNQDKATERRMAAATRAAVIPAGRSAASIQTKDLDDMTPAELWAYYDAQDRAAAAAR